MPVAGCKRELGGGCTDHFEDAVLRRPAGKKGFSDAGGARGKRPRLLVMTGLENL